MSALSVLCADVGEGARGPEAARLVTDRLSQPFPLGGAAENHAPRYRKRGNYLVPEGDYKAVDACEDGRWHLLWGEAGKPEGWKPCAFLCGSWRHPGSCAQYRSQVDFMRLKEALGRYALRDITFGVLTLDPKRDPGLSVTERYHVLLERWTMLAREVRRRWGKLEYFLSLEQHKSGLPHFNLIMTNAAIAQHLRDKPPTARDVEQKLAPHWWRDLVAGCGFGARASLAHVVSKEHAASYCTKVEKGAQPVPDALGAEVVKLSQLPLAAPKRTRRIRTSRRFLPPLVVNPEISGRLVRTPLPATMAEQAHEGMKKLSEHVRLFAEHVPLPDNLDKLRADQLQAAVFDWAGFLKRYHQWPMEWARLAKRRLVSVPPVDEEGAAARWHALAAMKGNEGWRYEMECFKAQVWLKADEKPPSGPSEEALRAKSGRAVAEAFHAAQDGLKPFTVAYAWEEAELKEGVWRAKPGGARGRAVAGVHALDARDARATADHMEKVLRRRRVVEVAGVTTGGDPDELCVEQDDSRRDVRGEADASPGTDWPGLTRIARAREGEDDDALPETRERGRDEEGCS